MNDRLKGFPSHDDVDEFAVVMMTMLMIVTIIMTNVMKRYKKNRQMRLVMMTLTGRS